MNQLDFGTRYRIEHAIKSAMRLKLDAYKPETAYKPFHTRLLGNDQMQLYSFVHSLITNFGAAIYEPVAAELAGIRFANVALQRPLPTELHAAASNQIDAIVDDRLVGERNSDRSSEDELIDAALLADGVSIRTRLPKVDLWLEDHDGSIMMFELKTVKPNTGNFEQYKRNLLRWYAAGVANFPGRRIRTAIALPYNPYYPKPYQRWTLQGMLDFEKEVFIAEDFWNFLAGFDVHDELLDCFERAGVELRDEIDAYFGRFRAANH